MLTLDIKGALGKAITPTYGIPDSEFSAIRTSIRKYTEDWLAEREQGLHAWSMNPYDKDALGEIDRVGRSVLAHRPATIVWIGIGGSSLAPAVLREAFEGPSTPQLLIVDTIDPSTIGLQLSLVDWKSAVIVVASKSGSTLETMAAFFACYERLKQSMKGGAAERVVAITDPEGGPLRALANDEGFYTLAIPPGVGGRFSVFTPIGLLALKLLGGSVQQFLRGAKEMDTFCQETTLGRNPAATLAAVQFLLDTKRGYPIRVIMPYGDRLQSMGRWCQQLLAESLGKTEGSNPIPLAAIGTQDQHSLLQQWMAGPRQFWHLFIRDIEKERVEIPESIPEHFTLISGKTFGQLLDACYEGTSQALSSAKRPTVSLSLQRLDELHLGQLFFLFLTETVYLGKLYRIDIYGQPAVEIGKKITKSLLTRGYRAP